MSACKDCFHYEACGGLIEFMGHVGKGILDNADKLCNCFKDKSRFVELPCKIGDVVYQIYDYCDFDGDCGTKRMCKGCEYRNMFVAEESFCLSMLDQNGRFKHPYYLTREAAEEALKEYQHD